jgi:hypothetical protein
MKVYLAKKDGTVIRHTDLAAMKQIDGIETPDRTVTVAEWEDAGGMAYIDGTGEIVLGEPAEEKARQVEMTALIQEEAILEIELSVKDYKVIKASEVGETLAQTDPDLHTRRDWCRVRINEIRARIGELEAGA